MIHSQTKEDEVKMNEKHLHDHIDQKGQFQHIQDELFLLIYPCTWLLMWLDHSPQFWFNQHVCSTLTATCMEKLSNKLNNIICIYTMWNNWRCVLEDPRLPFVVLVGKDTKQLPQEPWVVNTKHDPSHFNKATWKLVEVLVNHWCELPRTLGWRTWIK